MQSADPFRVLGLAPTLDGAAIKRAYFAAVRRVPPHADPEGFRAVRSAYEVLQDRARLQSAFLRAPLDAAAGLAQWEARFGARIQEVCATQRAQAESARAVELVIERCMQLRVE